LAHDRRPFRQQQYEEYDSLVNNEYVKHDLERLRKILGPCKDIEELEEVLTWPQKAQAELDAEWSLLCNEYTKLTGETQPMDGTEVPSMSDLCYYIGDWAIKYAEMGNTMPTTSGKTPVLPPYWAKNQVLLYADNGRLCPPEFKKEMDDEVFYLLHTTNVEGQDDNDIKKLETVMKYFFFAGKDLARTFECVCEEYEKRLRRGLMQVKPTPFSDLLYKMTNLNKDTQLSQMEKIELVKSFVVECEELRGRQFDWGLKNATFDLRLPSCSPPPSSADSYPSPLSISLSSTPASVVPLRKWQKLKGMATIMAGAFSFILLITMFFNYLSPS